MHAFAAKLLPLNLRVEAPTGVYGLKLLVYEALSYWCMRIHQ
jgi:hypothetical protein